MANVEINVMQNGLEKLMAFTINRNLVFTDSVQFMNPSLDELVKNSSDNDSKYLSQEWWIVKVSKTKGVYPHEYINNFNRSFGDKLSDRREFYSSLKDKYVSENDYFHAVNVWNAFKMKTMGDYHDLYLKTEDVILLADVFEKFIGVSLKYYGLDPCHYFNSPESSWDAMLNMTSVE